MSETSTFSLRDTLEAGMDRQDGAPADAPVADAPAPRDDGRDEHGRFAPKEKADGSERTEAAPADPSAESPEVSREGEPEAVSRDENAAQPVSTAPPPGWSVASKAAWNELPEAVRADIAKREQEVDNGFAQYKGMGDLKHYSEAYARNGATVKQALDGYLEVDRGLATDFPGTIAKICQHYGINPQALAQHYLGQGTQAPAQQDPTAARVAQLEQHIANQQREAERATLQSAEQTITQFAADPAHPYFENVKATMGHLINTGQATDLNDAYEKACWLHPDTRTQLLKQQAAVTEKAAQQKRQAAATQARASARGITGSPTPGATSGSQPSKQNIRDIIASRIDAQESRA